MSETPRQTTEQDVNQPELSDKQRAKINHSWTIRLAVILLLGLSAVAAKMCGRPETEPYTMSDLEKETTELINKKIMSEGGTKADNGNALDPELKGREKKGKIVLLKWPGQRKKIALKKNKKDETVIEKEEQKEQKFPINENCVERMEKFRECVNRTLLADPRIIAGFQPNGLYLARAINQVTVKDRIKCFARRLKRRFITVKVSACVAQEGLDSRPLVTGECAFELSALDASTGRIPHKTDEKGRAVTLEEEKTETSEDRKKVKDLMIEATNGQVGLHDLAMECGFEAGFLGGHCSRQGNPYLYEGVENITKDDPRYDCKRDSEKWKANRAYLAENSPPESYDDAHDRLKKVNTNLYWEAIKEKGKKGVDVVKKAGKKVLDAGSKLLDKVLRRRR